MKKTKLPAVFFSSGIYSAEAVKLAAAVFSGRAVVRLSSAKGGCAAEVSGYEGAAGDFANEALNQQCRLDLERKGSKIAGMIATKALLSAAGGKVGK
jgi:hypothetical protein